MSPPRVLVVAWGLPPCRGPGVYRALAMLRVLRDLGASVTALTASRETFLVLYGADTSLESHIPAGVELIRVPFAPPAMWPVVNDWSKDRATRRKDWRRRQRAVDLATYPEYGYASWLRGAVAAAVTAHRATPFDFVVATGNPYVDFEIAWALHEYGGVPFVLDDRDSFLYDVYRDEPDPLFSQRIDRYRDYLSGCLEYWCVNPPIADRHRSQAGSDAGKIHVVENGWDSAFAPAPAQRATASGDRVRVGYVGTLTPGFPIDQLLTAWRVAVEETGTPAELSLVGDIGFQRSGGDRIRGRIDGAREWGVTARGRVPKADLPGLYSELDGLLFLKEGSALVTSGKVYEYIATGLPIIALGIDGLDAARVLQGYPRLHTGSLDDPGRAASAIASGLADARSTLESAADIAAFAERYDRDKVLRPALGRVLAQAC